MAAAAAAPIRRSLLRRRPSAIGRAANAHANAAAASPPAKPSPAPPAAGPATTTTATTTAATTTTTTTAAAAAILSAALLLGVPTAFFTPPPPALAAGSEKLGEFAASGLIFKDSVEISALQDGDLPGVVLYIADFKRSITDKLSKDFFSEPSQASITCALDAAAAAPLASESTADLARRLGGAGGEGKEVFAERKGLNVFKNKTLRIRRLLDPDRRAAVFVAYSTRLGTAGDEGSSAGVSTGRYRTSVCAVPLPAYAGGGGAGGGVE
jgi:catabolite regulation protein CreA